MKVKNLILALFLVIDSTLASHSQPAISQPNLLNDTVIDSLKNEQPELYNQKKYAQLLLILYKLKGHYTATGENIELQNIQLSLADINRASQNFEEALEITRSLLKTVSVNDQEFIADVYSLRSAIYY